MRRIHCWPMYSPHKGPVIKKVFPCHDVIMDKIHLPNDNACICTVCYKIAINRFCTCAHIAVRQSCLWSGVHFTNDFFCRNSKSTENSRCYNSVTGHRIPTKFCTCHESTAVVITSLEPRWERKEISTEFEFRWKKHSWNRPPVQDFYGACIGNFRT